jgi:CBS domain-containing protein
VNQAYDPRPLNQLLHKYLVKQVNLSPGLKVSGKTPLAKVIESMRQEKSGCVVTVEGEKITGIFTERDLLTKVMNEKVDWNEPVSKFITPDPVTMKSDEPLRKALFLMRKKNFRHIPITGDQGELTGVLSVRNVIRLFSEHFPQEIMNLPPQSNSAPATPEGG